MEELKKREEIESKFKWKVEKIYKNIDEWEKEFNDLKNEAHSLKDFSGKLNCGENILEYLKLSEEISRKAEKLYIYAHLKSDEDTSNATYQSLMSKIDIWLSLQVIQLTLFRKF